MKRIGWAGIAAGAIAARDAAAVSLGDMAKNAEDDLNIVTGFLEIAFYLLGLLVVAFGFFRVKKHMDQPQQVSLASAIVAILIGAAIILISGGARRDRRNLRSLGRDRDRETEVVSRARR